MPEAQTIPDIKEIVDPPVITGPLDWWVWPAVTAGLVLAAVLVRVLHHRAARRAETTPAPCALAAALDELRALKEHHSAVPAPELAERTVCALRSVLLQRFGIGRPSETTAEFFRNNRQALEDQFGARRHASLIDILKRAERLHFGPDPDAPAARLPLAEAAIGFLRGLPPPRESPEDHADPLPA